MDQQMSKIDFWEVVVSTKIKSGIKAAANAAYLTAVITIIVAFFIDKYMIVDGVITLLLGLGIQFKKSRICACVITAYFIIGKITLLNYRLTAVGLLVAIGFIILYANGIKYTFEYQKLWKSYLNGENLPVDKDKADMNKVHEFIAAQNLTQGKELQGTEILFEANRVDRMEKNE